MAMVNGVSFVSLRQFAVLPMRLAASIDIMIPCGTNRIHFQNSNWFSYFKSYGAMTLAKVARILDFVELTWFKD